MFQRTQEFPLGQRFLHSTFPTNHLLWDKAVCIQGVPKMLLLTSGVGFPHQNQGKIIPINTRPQILSFQGTAQQNVDPRS